MTEIKYDKITTRIQNPQIQKTDNTVEYGIICGNELVVFIKVGLKGSIYGFNDKYVSIAKNLNEKYGCTVIVASNPNGYDDDFEDEMRFVDEYAASKHLEKYIIYYMGHSNGAALGMIHAWKYPRIKRLLCINGPLMINPQKLIPGIRKFNGEKMYLVYGSRDPSFGMVKVYSELQSQKIEFVRIKNADHDFTGYLDLFSELPGIYLFDEEIKNKSAFPLSRNLVILYSWLEHK